MRLACGVAKIMRRLSPLAVLLLVGLVLAPSVSARYWEHLDGPFLCSNQGTTTRLPQLGCRLFDVPRAQEAYFFTIRRDIVFVASTSPRSTSSGVTRSHRAGSGRNQGAGFTSSETSAAKAAPSAGRGQCSAVGRTALAIGSCSHAAPSTYRPAYTTPSTRSGRGASRAQEEMTEIAASERCNQGTRSPVPQSPRAGNPQQRCC